MTILISAQILSSFLSTTNVDDWVVNLCEYIAKIKEAEIELLNQHLDSVTRENELLKEALLHIKTNLMVLQTVESENEAKAYPSGSLEDTSQQHELQNLAFPLDDHSAGLKILPKGKP